MKEFVVRTSLMFFIINAVVIAACFMLLSAWVGWVAVALVALSLPAHFTSCASLWRMQ